MKKSKKLVVILCVLVIVILLVTFSNSISKNNKVDRVAALYSNLQDNQNFTFSMKELSSEFEYSVTIMQRGTDIDIDVINQDERTSTLVLEGYAYYILHNEQEYYVYDSEYIDADIILSGLEETVSLEYTSGTEEIYGEEYYYEEFEGVSTFAILVDIGEDSTIKTRFYFDGDDIIYIKNIVTTEVYDENNEENSETQEDTEEEQNNVQEELLKITVTYEVEDSYFEIPEEYAEIVI